MNRLRMLLVLALAAAGAAPATGQQASAPSEAQSMAALERFTSATLTRFASEEEFAAYVEAVDRADDLSERQGRRRLQLARAQTESGVQDDVPEDLCPPDEPACASQGEDDAGSVIVTASRISPSNPSITNNQMVNVDEGDIVKQIGRFLLVLSDGRISSSTPVRESGAASRSPTAPTSIATPSPTPGMTRCWCSGTGS